MCLFNSAFDLFYVTVIVSSASEFVVLVYSVGRKKVASLYYRRVYRGGPIAQSLERKWFRRIFFSFNSTEFHLDAAGFYLQLSELCVCCSKDSAFFCSGNLARQTVESFSLDEIENRTGAHVLLRTQIKTDFFCFNNFNCTWSLQNEGEETLVVEDLDCNLSTV